MRWFSRLLSTTVIKIEGKKITCLKGKIPSSGLREISSIVASAQISSGEIYLNGLGKIEFTSNIPTSLHQSIRNSVLHNDSL